MLRTHSYVTPGISDLCTVTPIGLLPAVISPLAQNTQNHSLPGDYKMFSMLSKQTFYPYVSW